MSSLATLNFSKPVTSLVEQHIKETMPIDVDCSCSVCPRQPGASYKLIKKNESCHGFRFKFRNNAQGTHVYDKSTMIRTGGVAGYIGYMRNLDARCDCRSSSGSHLLELGLDSEGHIDKLTTTHIAPHSQFDSMDKNNDGGVTIDEYLHDTHPDDADKHSKVFDSLDKNYDGVLTIDEMPEEAEEEEVVMGDFSCASLNIQVGKDWTRSSTPTGAPEPSPNPLIPGSISWKIWNYGTPFDASVGPSFNNRWNGKDVLAYMNNGGVGDGKAACGRGADINTPICVGIAEVVPNPQDLSARDVIGFCYPAPPPPPPDTTGCSALHNADQVGHDWRYATGTYNPDPLKPGSISWKTWNNGTPFDLGPAFNLRWNGGASGEEVVGYMNDGIGVADGAHCGIAQPDGTAICVGIGELEHSARYDKKISTIGFCYPNTPPPPPGSCSYLDKLVATELLIAGGATQTFALVQGSLIWLKWKGGEYFPTDLSFAEAGAETGWTLGENIYVGIGDDGDPTGPCFGEAAREGKRVGGDICVGVGTARGDYGEGATKGISTCNYPPS